MENTILSADASEPALIGALLHEYQLIHTCRTQVFEDTFGDILYAAIYRTMLGLVKTAKGKFDLKSVFTALKSVEEFKGKTDEDVIQLLNDCKIASDPALIDLYIDNVKSYHIRRKLDAAGERTRLAARNMLITADEAVAAAENAVLTIGGERVGNSADDNADFKARLLYNFDNPRAVRGFNSGFPLLDSLTTGFGGGRQSLNLFFGSSHVGKSMIVQQILMNLCDPNKNNLHHQRIAVAPTEMTPEAWKERLVAFIMGVSTRTLQTGNFAAVYRYKDKSPEYIRQFFSDTMDYVNSLPIDWIWYKYRFTTGSDILGHAMTGRYAAIFVDGLKDLGQAPGAKMNDDAIYSLMRSNCNYLHQAALMTSTPMFVTNQMKTMQAARKDRRPMPSDLFGGQDIYERSTFTMAIYREVQHVFTGGANDRRMTAEQKRRAIAWIYKDRWGGSEGKSLDLEMIRDGGMGFKELGIRNDE